MNRSVRVRPNKAKADHHENEFTTQALIISPWFHRYICTKLYINRELKRAGSQVYRCIITSYVLTNNIYTYFSWSTQFFHKPIEFEGTYNQRAVLSPKFEGLF